MRQTSHKLRKVTVGLLVAAVLGVLVMPAFAAAEGSGTSSVTVATDCGPTIDQYGNRVDQINCVERDGGGLGDPVGPLPFTGFDVIAMLAVALAVTGLGLALQRAVSRQTDG